MSHNLLEKPAHLMSDSDHRWHRISPHIVSVLLLLFFLVGAGGYFFITRQEKEASQYLTVAYSQYVDGFTHMFVRDSNGMVFDYGLCESPAWQPPANQYIICSDKWTMKLVSLETGEHFLLGNGFEPTFAPGGVRVAYTGWEGTTEHTGIFVATLVWTPLPVLEDIVQVSSIDGSSHPVWSRDGNAIYFQTPSRTFHTDANDYGIRIGAIDLTNKVALKNKMVTEVFPFASWTADRYGYPAVPGWDANALLFAHDDGSDYSIERARIGNADTKTISAGSLFTHTIELTQPNCGWSKDFCVLIGINGPDHEILGLGKSGNVWRIATLSGAYAENTAPAPASERLTVALTDTIRPEFYPAYMVDTGNSVLSFSAREVIEVSPGQQLFIHAHVWDNWEPFYPARVELVADAHVVASVAPTSRNVDLEWTAPMIGDEVILQLWAVDGTGNEHWGHEISVVVKQ